MTTRESPPVSPGLEIPEPSFLGGGGEMGALMRAHDWTSSSLGPPESWPQSLRTVVRLVLNTGHPMYIWWGADLACLYNDAYRESIGPEMHPGSLGRPAREVWSEIWDIIGPQIEQVMSGGGATWQVDHLVPITRHGRREEVYWTYSYSPIDDRKAPGGIGGILVVCTETTQQVLAARRLTIERDQLSQLFEQAPTFMAMLRGPDHRFELANPSYMQLVGHRPVIGRTVAEALPDAVAQGYLTLLDQVFTSGRAYVARGAKFAVLATPEGPGAERYVDFVYQPIKDSDGKVAGIFVEGADVTERTRADAALRLLEPRLQGLLETIPGFIWTADANGEIDYISPRFAEYVGRDEARFKSAFWPEFMHPDDLPNFVAAWSRANATGTAFQVDVRFLRADGVWRWLDIRAEPDLGADGRTVRWFGYGEDQHEQKEIADALQASEARFRQTAAQLSEASRLKDEFLATLAHELRNPLAPIQSALDSLKIAPGNGDVAITASKTMERQLALMVRLIDDLLDLSRVSRGIIELRRTRLPLAEALRDAVETSRPLMERCGHLCAVTLPGEELLLEADPARIVQVFANLLNNAAKFTPRGGRIELTLARQDPQTAIVSVRDNGIGIPAAKLASVFDMFTQVDRSHAQVGGGLGIGLTLARRLVEMHGGTIEAQSAGPGAGSEFRVHLPLVPAAPSQAAADAIHAPATISPTPGRRVLVADDNVDAAESLSLVLALLGHEVRTAHDGEQALALARDFHPDVMILDVAMPKLNGHDLARRLRTEPWANPLLLIAASGWGNIEDKQLSRAAGFDHHLVKPVEISALEKLLRPAGA